MARALRLARRERDRFAALSALHRGLAPRRLNWLERWFPPRQILIQGPQHTVVVRLGRRVQVATVALFLLTSLGFVASIAAAAWSHFTINQMAEDVAELRSTSEVETARAAGDRERLHRLAPELAQCSSERDRAAGTAFSRSMTVAEQKAAIARLIAERDQALAERDSAVAANRDMLLTLDARTQSTIAEVERIIASTGLEPGRVVRLPAMHARNAPRGGPFVPWREVRAVERPTGAETLDGVASGLDRLQALRDGLKHLPLASPVTQVVISDGFGYRRDPFTGNPAMHEGLDLRGTYDGPVYATAAGIVSFAGWKSEYGRMVEVDHGAGLVTRYAHLSRILVKPGEAVELHRKVGTIGATGRATAAHLHYEVRVDGRARNPVSFLKADRYVPQTGHDLPKDLPTAFDQFSGFALP